MAALAKGKLRDKTTQLGLALDGRVEEQHRFLLRLQLRRLQAVEKDLAEVEERIQQKLLPYQAEMELLRGAPGIEQVVAAVVISEMGVDMGVFASVSHLTAWAGVSPGNHESAGKRKNRRVNRGNVYLKAALVEAALAASRQKGTYLREKFYRVKARRGYKRAAIAIAHKLTVSIYHMLARHVPYHELGDLYLDNLNKNHLARNLVRRLERLGYNVCLQPKSATA
jgi:transposase